jgi:hypothetical protein
MRTKCEKCGGVKVDKGMGRGERECECVSECTEQPALPSATGSAHGVIPFETVAKALGMVLPEPPKYPRCTCHSVRSRIRRWKEDAEDALSGKYGDAPKGEGMDYWRGQRAVLYELDALHDYPGGAMEEENAALKDAMEALKDYVDGKRSDSENISAIINGALKLNAPNEKADLPG